MKCVPRGEGACRISPPPVPASHAFCPARSLPAWGKQSGGVGPESGARMRCDPGQGDPSSVVPLEVGVVPGDSSQSPEYPFQVEHGGGGLGG